MALFIYVTAKIIAFILKNITEKVADASEKYAQTLGA